MTKACKVLQWPSLTLKNPIANANHVDHATKGTFLNCINNITLPYGVIDNPA